MLKDRNSPARAARCGGLGLLAAALVALSASAAAAAGPRTWYVSDAHGNNANPCTAADPCKTIQHAVSAAHSGDTITVEKGTYTQFISIQKRLRIIGSGGPVLDQDGRDNGFNIIGKKAAGTEISGFTIKRATFEGILARRTSRLTISNNVVENNDQGMHASAPTGECAPFGGGPGDCGEAVHLVGVTNSTISGNVVRNNLGGILLTDELGPTAHNMIKNNRLLNNKADCGITLAGHNPNAAPGGKPAPKAAGIYGNTIIGNTANGNGTKGEGAGILMAGAAPGTAVYDNLVENNTANGNGLAGFTLHSHAPGQDLNGNRIIGNKLSHNGVADMSEGEFGPTNFPNTVGILVGSGFTKLKGIVITGNTISNSHFGIYTKNAPKVSAKKNTFHKVKVKVKQV